MKHLGQNMSSLFRQNKLPPNLAAENNRHFLPEGFCELGLRERLSSSCFPLRTRWPQWHRLQAWGPPHRPSGGLRTWHWIPPHHRDARKRARRKPGALPLTPERGSCRGLRGRPRLSSQTPGFWFQRPRPHSLLANTWPSHIRGRL